MQIFFRCLIVVNLLVATIGPIAHADDPLPSWNNTPSKSEIIAFVQRVTNEGAPDFVPAPERIAVFDNDGTLWAEAPIPFQVAFALDEVKRRAAKDAKLAADPMVKAALAGDIGKLLAGKHHDGLLHILGLTHAGMTTDKFDTQVKDWLASAKHPRFDKPYSELTYQPMQELLRYLRANGFKTFIVSGGGADFMRVFSEQVYGIPPENVIGSHTQVKYEMRDGVPTLVKTTDHLFVDDKEGKPVGIHQFIGRRPIACFGNSNGDQAMLEYTTIGNPRPSFGLIVHHTDADREYAYDANPKGSGKLTTALDAAAKWGWTVVDMKTDWNQIWNTADSAKTPDTKNSIVGKWLVTKIEQRAPVDNSQPILEVSKDGTISGNSAVNSFAGKANIVGPKINFGLLAMTRRAGTPELMKQELRFMEALAKAASFRIENKSLELLDSGDKVVVRLTRDE